MKKKQKMQTFIQIEREWVPTGEDRVKQLPGTRLLVGEESLYVVHIN